jgi:hypothetical protein
MTRGRLRALRCTRWHSQLGIVSTAPLQHGEQARLAIALAGGPVIFAQGERCSSAGLRARRCGGRGCARRFLLIRRRSRFAAQDHGNHRLRFCQQQLALLVAVLIAPFETGLIWFAWAALLDAAHICRGGNLYDSGSRIALGRASREPTEKAPDRRQRFRVIQGGRT